jgi:hypothetical protein
MVLQGSEPIQKISTINNHIERLATQLPTTIHKMSRQTEVAGMCLRIRSYANNLHGIFQQKFQDKPACQCQLAHNVNLHLARIPTEKTSRQHQTAAVRFKVLFSFDGSQGGPPINFVRVPWAWREMEFEVAEVANMASDPVCMATTRSMVGGSQALASSIGAVLPKKKRRLDQITSVFREKKPGNSKPAIVSSGHALPLNQTSTTTT